MAQAPADLGRYTNDYYIWVNKEKENNICMIEDEKHGSKKFHDGFVAASALETYMKPKLSWLLHETFHGRDTHVQPSDINPDYLRAFAALLYIGYGAYIQYFVKDERYQDQHLPLYHKPDDWPGVPTDSSWELFDKYQWIFFPVRLVRKDDKHHSRRVVPFIAMTYLDKGGSARLHRVRVHKDYDFLHAHGRSPDVHQQYVLKTYQGTLAETYYDTETKNFYRLRNSDKTSYEGLIEVHGSYHNGEQYNLIMEDAEGRSLKAWMEREREPNSGPGTAAHWVSFIGSMQGLEHIHKRVQDDGHIDLTKVFEGVHQDICLDNILLVRDPFQRNPGFPWLMRLSDLGLSHFERVENLSDSGKEVAGMLTGETYGSPESFRRSEFDQEFARPITQKIDIWALGCVIIEFATWLVQGKAEVDRFRKRRLAETKKVSEHKGDRFHNGKPSEPKVLTAVSNQVTEVLENLRGNDAITGHMLKLAVRMLDPDPAKRPKIGVVRQEAEALVIPFKKSHAHDNRVAHESMSSAGASTKRPSLSNPAVTSLPNLSSADKTRILSRSDTRPSSTMLVSSPVEMEQTITPVSAIGSLGNDANFQPRPMRNVSPERRVWSADGMQSRESADMNTFPMAEESHNQHNRSVSLPYRSKGRGSAGTNMQNSLGFGLSRPEESTQPQTPTEPIHPRNSTSEVLSSPTDVTSIQVSDQTVPAQPDAPLPPPAQSSTTRPCISFEEARTWADLFENQKLQFWKKVPQLSQRNDKYLKNLRNRDTTFLIDDGFTMKSHWEDVIWIFEILTLIITENDKGGPIKVCFTNSDDEYTSKDYKDLVEKLGSHDVDGNTDIAAGLQRVSTQCLPASFHRHMSKHFRKHGTCEDKSIIVLTDAVWGGGADAHSQIQWICRSLAQRGAKRKNFGIQFVRFGHDESLKTRLEDLDDGRAGGFDMDIVDTEYWSDNVLKILLGSFMNIFD